MCIRTRKVDWLSKNNTRIRRILMINSAAQTGVSTTNNLNEKINRLTNTLMNKNLLDKCTPKDKMDVSVILNEIKYDLHRIKNLKLVR